MQAQGWLRILAEKRQVEGILTSQKAFWKISHEVRWLKETGWSEGAQKKKMEVGSWAWGF